MKLRRSNLRQMMNQGLVNDQIRRQVLEGLKQIVTFDDTWWVNGDLKERVHLFTGDYHFLIKQSFKLIKKAG